MDYDTEKGHGQPTEIFEAPTERAQRLLTAEEKLAATTVDVNSRGSESSIYIEYNSTPVKQDDGILSKLRRLEAKMDMKLGVEVCLSVVWSGKRKEVRVDGSP